jgi:hypothetical protein
VRNYGGSLTGVLPHKKRKEKETFHKDSERLALANLGVFGHVRCSSPILPRPYNNIISSDIA